MRGTDSSTKVGPGDVEETDSFHGSNCKAFGTEVRGVKISQGAGHLGNCSFSLILELQPRNVQLMM